MSTALKTILILALAAAAAFGVFWLIGGGRGTPPDLHGTQPVPPPTGPPPEVGGQDPGRAHTPPTGTQPEERTEVVADRSGASLPQGVRGRAVDTLGNPLRDVEVFLVDAPRGGVFEQVLALQRGVKPTALASCTTGADGKFALGLRTVAEGFRELRLLGGKTVDRAVGNLAVRPDEWLEVGDVALETGAVLAGRVTAEAGGAPIPGAVVAVQAFQGGSIAPTPGREKGIPAVTDDLGFYRFENLPPGVCSVAASAPGFARIERYDVRVAGDGPTEVLFQLPTGLSISGTVVDPEGTPVPGVALSAVSMSTKTPMLQETRSGEGGAFTLDSLIDAPFELTARATGFLLTQVRAVQAGTREVRVVIEKMGTARLRVLDGSGKRVDRFRVGVERYFPQNEQYAAAFDAPPRNVEARDLDAEGGYAFAGLNPGHYAFQVELQGYARTRSATFEVAAARGAPTPFVEVKMTAGGSIAGVVVDPEGKPLAGCAVSTMVNNMVDSELVHVIDQLTPNAITRASATTDAEGRFALTTLSPGAYQLRVEHRAYCVGFHPDVEVKDGERTQVPELKLDRGTAVSGTVRVDGRPAPGIKVSIHKFVEPENPGRTVMADTATDSDGRFVFPVRFPPGRYTIRAARDQSNPLAMMLDYKNTAQDITLAADRDSFTYDVNILSN